MLPIKRLEEIKRILTENKQADVPSLAQELNVTEATIRRDLEKLENEQFLTRTHGGAVLNEQEPSESYFSYRIQTKISIPILEKLHLSLFRIIRLSFSALALVPVLSCATCRLK